MTIDDLPVTSLNRGRAATAKRAFTTRRVPVDDMRTLIGGSARPTAGDLVLATIDEIGQHKRLELSNGRRAHLFSGDEIIVCFGNRYAPDQFEAVVGSDLGSCDLVAAGGVAACELSRHERMVPPTRISPIGLVGDADGNRLNLRDYAIASENGGVPITVVLVAGTSMNSGKTLAAASLVRGLKAAGNRVAAIKATGTGAGNDIWIMWDVGADVVVDFTDAGFVSTYKASPEEIEKATLALIKHAAHAGCSFAVIEIADGLQQQETAVLMRSKALRFCSTGVLFAAYDAMGAKAGVDSLNQLGHRVLAVSGRLTRSPLAIREAKLATGHHILTPWELQAGALVGMLVEGSSARDGWIPSIGHNSARPMASNGMANLKPSEDIAGTNFNHEMLGFVAGKLMELETTYLCGAGHGKRSRSRKNVRNGYRPRRWKTPNIMIDLRIPKLRMGSYFPTFLKPRTDAERALLNFVEEAHTRGFPSRSVDELVKAMGMLDANQNDVSQLWADIEEKTMALLARPDEGIALAHRGDYVSRSNCNDEFDRDDLQSDDFGEGNGDDVDGDVIGFEHINNHHAGTFGTNGSLLGNGTTGTASSDVVEGEDDLPLTAAKTRRVDKH